MEDEYGYTYLPLSSRHLKARKRYICDGCGKPIEIGTKYWRNAMIYDGVFQMNRSHHRDCWADED